LEIWLTLKHCPYNKSVSLLNALNIKYLLVEVKDGQSLPITNPYINGNAWFVSKIQNVNSADEEIKSLAKIDTKEVAVRQKESYETSVISMPFQKDSLATIKLNVYKPNHIEYTSTNSNNGFAVFSETYYKEGWKATIDGKETPIKRVDYVLRGLDIPKGKHTIVFKFEPQVVKTGGTIALFEFNWNAIGYYWRTLF